MRFCPTCQRKYEDDTLVFCLDDGSRLIDENATLNLPVDPTIAALGSSPKSPPTNPNPIPTITAKPEQFQMPRVHHAVQTEARHSSRSPLPWIFAIVAVLGLSGVVIAWLVTSGRDSQANNQNQQATPMPSPTVSREATPDVSPDSTPEQTPIVMPTRPRDESTPPATPMPTKEKPKPAFTVLDNMTFNGSRITYYPRPTFGGCQADCLANPNCRGFTWIRPGAYNPGDSAMCYLMSALTARVPHACCISGVRN